MAPGARGPTGRQPSRLDAQRSPPLQALSVGSAPSQRQSPALEGLAADRDGTPRAGGPALAGQPEVLCAVRGEPFASPQQLELPHAVDRSRNPRRPPPAGDVWMHEADSHTTRNISAQVILVQVLGVRKANETMRWHPAPGRRQPAYAPLGTSEPILRDVPVSAQGLPPSAATSCLACSPLHGRFVPGGVRAQGGAVQAGTKMIRSQSCPADPMGWCRWPLRTPTPARLRLGPTVRRHSVSRASPIPAMPPPCPDSPRSQARRRPSRMRPSRR